MSPQGGAWLDISPSDPDVAAWWQHVSRRDAPVAYWLRVALPAALFSPILVHAALNESIAHTILTLVLGVAACLASVFLMPIYRQWRWTSQLGASPSPSMRLTVDGRGLRVVSPQRQRELAWGIVSRIDCSWGRIFVEAPPQDPVIIPGSTFVQDPAREAFLRFLRDFWARSPRELPAVEAPPNAVAIAAVDAAEEAAQIADRSGANGATATRLAMMAVCAFGAWVFWPWWQDVRSLFFGLACSWSLVDMVFQTKLTRASAKKALERYREQAAGPDGPSYVWFEDGWFVLACPGVIDRFAWSAMGEVVVSDRMVTVFAASTAAVSIPSSSFPDAAAFGRFVQEIHGRRAAAHRLQAA